MISFKIDKNNCSGNSEICDYFYPKNIYFIELYHINLNENAF